MSAGQSETGPLEVVRNGLEFMQQYDGSQNVDADDGTVDAKWFAKKKITAGDLVERVDGGVQPHSTAAGAVYRPLVAIDARMFGMEAGGTYQVGNDVFVVAPHGGGLWMRLAGGEKTAISQALVSAGDGTLLAFDSAAGHTPEAVIGTAAEAVDNSGGTSPMWVPVDF